METLRILLVEDDEDDYLLTRDLLTEVFGETLKLDWVWTWEAALQALSSQQHDVYLVDYRLGAHDGLELVSTATALDCTAPILMLTGQGTRETDLAAQATGAADYLVKSEITAPLLDRAIRYAMERKKVERHLATLAQFDSLTGLANRRLFQERLKAAISQAERTKSLLAVLLIDLDHFKDINDTLGHPVGDILLKQVASRLRSNVRQTDTVARLSGDEFAIIATNLTQADDAGTLARKFIGALNQPFVVADQELFITSSIGITLFPMDTGNSDYLLKNADMALYQAKAEGRDNYRFYDTEMNNQAQTRKALTTALRLALQNQDLYLQFQPKVAIASQQVTGAEALLRWHHPERGTLFPNEFIPLAETNGLIIPLGEWVLWEVCRQIKRWRESGLPILPIAVNLSAIQFKRADVVGTVIRLLEQTKLEPSLLEFEITESIFMCQTESVIMTLQRLRELGIRLTLDDFGTGFCSLAYLRHFPVDTLKIDRSFIAGVTTRLDDAAITKTIITLSQSLNLNVVAEGVESQDQLDFLRQQGCREAQGNFLSPPLGAAAFATWFQEIPYDIAVTER